jgi:aspartate carbamoyltransferase catalytic subunit
MKHLLGIEPLTIKEINLILDKAAECKKILQEPIPKIATLSGVTIVNLFCEPSTRTRTSFELAAKRVGADTVNIAASSSSFLKGETLKDTVKNIEAMRAEILVIRHSCSGAPHFLAQHTNMAVINAGDGFHEHPTQALLDIFTIRERLKSFKDLNVSIIGDIAHSRVALSNIFALKKLGANVTVCGPKTLIPAHIEKLGVHVTYDLKDAVHNADVLNVLRIQLERQTEAFFPSIREYAECFGINAEMLNKYAKKNVIILHPGPINREIELSNNVADGKHSLILHQVTNGVAIRMAVLSLLGKAICKH